MFRRLKQALEPDRNEYVVIHIPKTAGTSLNNVLAKVFGEEAISPPFDARAYARMNSRDLKKYTIVQGHIGWKDVGEHFPHCKKITFLREPLDRCLSWYYYLRGRGLDKVTPFEAISYSNSPEEAISLAKQLDIDSFFDSKHPHILQNIFNRQTYQLGDEICMEKRDPDIRRVLDRAVENLENVDFLGFFDDFDNEMKRLAGWLGYTGPVESVRSNATKVRLGVDDLQVSTRRRLEDLNQLDIEMYEQALKKRLTC